MEKYTRILQPTLHEENVIRKKIQEDKNDLGHNSQHSYPNYLNPNKKKKTNIIRF